MVGVCLSVENMTLAYLSFRMLVLLRNYLKILQMLPLFPTILNKDNYLHVYCKNHISLEIKLLIRQFTKCRSEYSPKFSNRSILIIFMILS